MKRFEMSDQSTVYRYSIIDNVENGVLKVNECVVLLNKLNDENEELRQELEENKAIINFCSNGDEDEDLHRLIKENEQLRQQLKEKQEDEKLYAQEILELNKTKKEMLNFKQLGGDY